MDLKKTESSDDLLRRDSACHVVAFIKKTDCDSLMLPLKSLQKFDDSTSSSSSVPLIAGIEEKLSEQNYQDITDSIKEEIPLSSFEDVGSRASMDKALKSEKAFIEYVLSLPPTSANAGSPHIIKPEILLRQKHSSIPSTSSNTTKVGLDHLDNLCKLMEQLSELRETNSKLQKRVQYLEDLKTLHEMHKELRDEVKYGSENVLNQRKHLGLKKCLTSVDYVTDCPRESEDYRLSSARGSEDLGYHIYRPLRGRSSPSSRTNKSYCTIPYDGYRRERSKSVGHEEVYDSRSKRIFPKWSRVKEAFGWESERKYSRGKASKSCYGTAVNTIGLPRDTRKILTECDFAAVRVPIYSDYSEKDDMNPTDSYAGEAMASCTESGIPVVSSSTEDLGSFLDGYRPGNHQKKSLTIERSMDAEQAFARFEKEESKKSHKSPWGRVKTIIERRRDSLKRRHLRRGPCLSTPPTRCHDPRVAEGIDDDSQDITIYDSQRKSSGDQIALGSTFAKTDFDELEKKRKKQTIQDSRESNNQRQDLPPPPIQFKTDEKYDCSESRVAIVSEREVLRTPGSSPQFHRKSTWMRMKNVLRNKKEESISGLSSQSMPSSPNGVRDNTFDFEDVDNPEENIDTTFSENSRAITRIGSDSYVHKLALSNESSPVKNLMIELQRNVSDDFSRKMQEWERIRNSGIRPASSPKLDQDNQNTKSRKKPNKSKTERYDKSAKPKVKDLAWLEKELQKIEKEKQRLSKEKEKYEERAIRLERLRETVLTARSSNKKEVLVRTSAGEFRFEGISDAFTKKLYEWETKRGLGPEFSTIALLDSSVRANNKNCLSIQQIAKCSNLQRAMSRSESSVAERGQPSHTSSNSLPSLKPPEICDLERIHHSRANSEPDLSSFTGVNNTNVAQTVLKENNDGTKESSRDTIEVDVKDSYVHPESAQLLDSDVDEVFRDIDDQGRVQRDENYYSLLEENVILLEQLKNKEEICRRLEKELHLLDSKVEEMNKHHLQEMERYREKLWEMHKPGNTPREVQGCLQVMSELRTRIDNLEKCSEKLRNEKETLEDSFRFHSAEQEHMTMDLIGKMRELQAAGETPKSNKTENIKNQQPTNFDIKIVERLQDLSNQLVKQTKELEEALAERTRQICQLRWELLHRDVSTVKLETELHSTHIKGANVQNSKCDIKRAKYAHFRSWSSEEASNRLQQIMKYSSHAVDVKTELPEAYYKLPKTEIQAIELSNTVHELNRELIRLSSAAESILGVDINVDDDTSQSTVKESVADCKIHGSQSIEKDMSLNMSSVSKHESCDALQMLSGTNVARSSKICVRRNSATSISMISTAEHKENYASENYNMNKSISNFPLTSDQKQEKKIYWSDSESSSEETLTRITFNQNTEKRICMPNREAVEIPSNLKNYKTNEYITESEDSQENYKEMYSPFQTRKRKVNYKFHRNSRKQTKTAETFQAQSKEYKQQNFEQMNTRKDYNVSGKLHANTHLYAHQCSEQSISKASMKDNKTISKTKNLARVYKSHSDRRSNSKAVTYDQINIRKSESLFGTKDRKIFKNASDLKEEPQANQSRKQWKEKAALQKILSNSRSNISGANTSAAKLTSVHTSYCSNEISCQCKILNQNSGNLSSIKRNNCKNKKIDCSTALQSEEEACVITPSNKISDIENNADFTKQQEQSCFSPAGYEENCSLQPDDEKDKNTMNVNSNIETQPTYIVKLPKQKSQIPNEQINCKLAQDKESICGKHSALATTVTVVLPTKDLENKNNFLRDCGNPEGFDYGDPVSNETFRNDHALHMSKNNNSSCAKLNKYHLNDSINISCTVSQADQSTDGYHTENEDCASTAANKERKINYVPTEQNTKADNQLKFNYFKSPSDTQIDWKRMCAKKTSKESAPNVKTLIEKYNQKVLECQTSRTPSSSTYNSPAASRKVSLPTKNSQYNAKNIPHSFSSTPSSPRVANSCLHTMLFKPINNDSFHSQSPPGSPNFRTRSAALIKAKETFISSSSITGFKQSNIMKTFSNKFLFKIPYEIENSGKENIKESATKFEIKNDEEERYRTSTSSNKSLDSMSFVLCKTGETCQESRLSKRNDKQKNAECLATVKSQLTATKSLSSSSIFKNLTSREIFPSSLFRLRRSHKKKDIGAVSQLCRQSLMLDDETFKSQEEKLTKSPRSCPSSPETQSKNKVKSSWITRNLFRHK